MNFRVSQSESRDRYLSTYDTEEASKYDSWITSMTAEDHEACVFDMSQRARFSEQMKVLDAGSGTGALSLALVRIPGLQITALEPCVAMSERFKSKPELCDIPVVPGFCDHSDDHSHFAPHSFDLVASRQLANCLFDPLAAFRNWFSWLRPGGIAIVMDGLFDRDAWTGSWDGMVDTLPLSACRTTAMVPYLLEQVGFRIDSVGPMEATNALASTRTERYLVAATKPTE